MAESTWHELTTNPASAIVLGGLALAFIAAVARTMWRIVLRQFNDMVDDRLGVKVTPILAQLQEGQADINHQIKVMVRKNADDHRAVCESVQKMAERVPDLESTVKERGR